MIIKRRDLLAATAAVAVVPAKAKDAPHPKHPVVLVHGASHGGWCWRDVRRRLQAKGLDVFTPTLTGLGERVHLRNADITLATHITDVVNVITWEELSGVVLVGHSLGGMVITGVCDALKDRIAHVIYLDAAVPENGEPAFPGMKAISEGALKEGYLMPAMPTVGLGLDEEHYAAAAAWVRRRLTDQPYPVWSGAIALKNGGSDGIARTFVQCTDPKWLPQENRERVKARRSDPSWVFVEKLGPHDVMITDPVWTADLIASRAV